MTARALDSSVSPVGTFPAPSDLRLALVFGGSFDPPHKGHFALPEYARSAIDADFLLYVPAARSPHKCVGPRASAEDRIAMLRAGLARQSRAGISTLEIDRATSSEAPSFTIDTLREFTRLMSDGAAMRLLIGADQAREFHRWREPQEIIKLAEPVVLLRGGEGDSRAALIESMRLHWSPDELRAWESRFVDAPIIHASATEARRILGLQGPDAPELATILPQAVIEVIRQRGLYAAEPKS